MKTRSRLAATYVLGWLALGVFAAASLAILADTAHPAHPLAQAASPTPAPRVVNSAVAPIDSAAEDLAWAARDALSGLQGLDTSAVRDAVARGDAAVATLTTQLANLGANNPAATSGADLPGLWLTIRTRATAVAALLDDLKAHNTGVIWAANSARSGNWTDALASLDQGTAALAKARADSAALDPSVPMPTLGNLFARYERYDNAVGALYRFMGNGRRHAGVHFSKLNGRVAVAQAGLPNGIDIFSSIVNEIAGTPLAGPLAKIGQARANIDALLNAPTVPAQ